MHKPKILGSQGGFAFIIIIIVVALTALGTTGYVVKTRIDAQNKAKVAEQLKQDQAKQSTPAKVTPAPTAVVPAASVATPAPACEKNLTRYVSPEQGVYIRESRSLTATKVIVVAYATELKVGCLESDWYAADYGGKSGYIFKDYLVEAKPVVAVAPVVVAPALPATLVIQNRTISCTGSMDHLFVLYNTPYYDAPNGTQLGVITSAGGVTGTCATTAGWFKSSDGRFFLGTGIWFSDGSGGK